ncbi:hypothetical protein BDV25DRAFT_149527 [Aspergillus avenaceus]|uniref:Uncharacterized protein n=1 Tax=Aspergillus avenaceus TaxID=36643 RepID=A0A5N6U497_ASPAV|nr:hypothetical protein BDV25DRAFT_149527 [Aspergillus avenaceus]
MHGAELLVFSFSYFFLVNFHFGHNAVWQSIMIGGFSHWIRVMETNQKRNKNAA